MSEELEKNGTEEVTEEVTEETAEEVVEEAIEEIAEGAAVEAPDEPAKKAGNCAVCGAPVYGENPPILSMGNFGNPRYLCDDCAATLDKATLSANPAEVAEALDALTARMTAYNTDDEVTIETMEELTENAAKRAKAIADGTYDFSLDTPEEEIVDLPEELLESEEDKELDRADAEALERAEARSKRLDGILAGIFAAALLAFILTKFVFKLW